MNAGGGVQQYSWGVQKVKGRKEERGARVGPVLDLGLGRFGSTQKACI